MAKVGGQTKPRGRGNFGNPEQHRSAGRKGGEATKRLHNQTFYAQIGAAGGKVSPSNFRFNPERARAAGRKGGRG